MRLARGPFWLGSISKLTRSPPASESKFTLESSPVRWKKYSFPSSAAMKPNPRSWTSFLIVPVGIEHSSSRKLVANARVLSRRSDRGEHHPATGGRDYLTTRFKGRPKKPSRIFATGLRSQKRDARQCCNCPCELQRSPALLAQAPHSPHRNGDRKDTHQQQTDPDELRRSQALAEERQADEHAEQRG